MFQVQDCLVRMVLMWVCRDGMTEDGRVLRIIDDGGGRTLWSRR
jgi:hypothetical protein